MTRFYAIRDRSLWARGMPWIARFTKGVVCEDECVHCRGGERYRADGDVIVRLDPGRGTQWPDLIGCGARVGLFVVSGHFVKALRAKGVRLELGGHVWFEEPVPKRVSLADAPDYHWVSGDRHRSAAMDFGASGYLGVERCAACDRWWYDIKNSKLGDFPVVFHYDATSGMDLFTTDSSPEAFYCTERVLECASEHRLTNVAFRPVEEGPFAKPVKYWR